MYVYVCVSECMRGGDGLFVVCVNDGRTVGGVVLGCVCGYVCG